MTLSLAALAPPSAIPPEGGGAGEARGCRGGGPPGPELYSRGLLPFVVAAAAAEQHVAAGAATEEVLAGAAEELVITLAAVEEVRAAAADQAVVALAARQLVRVGAAR